MSPPGADTPASTGALKRSMKPTESGVYGVGLPANNFGVRNLARTRRSRSSARPHTASVSTCSPSSPSRGGSDPLYRYLTSEEATLLRREIRWNFTKFLVGKDGSVIARFEPSADPTSEEVTAASRSAREVARAAYPGRRDPGGGSGERGTGASVLTLPGVGVRRVSVERSAHSASVSESVGWGWTVSPDPRGGTHLDGNHSLPDPVPPSRHPRCRPEYPFRLRLDDELGEPVRPVEAQGPAEALQGNRATSMVDASFLASASVSPHQAISGSVKTTAG